MKIFSLFTLLCLFSACVWVQTSAVDIHAAVDTQLHINEQKHGIPGQAVLVLHNSDRWQHIGHAEDGFPCLLSQQALRYHPRYAITGGRKA